MNRIKTIAVVLPLVIGSLFACKSGKKTAKAETEQKPFIAADVSNISLYDKSADTIKAYIADRKWQMQYAIGGIAGDDKRTYPATFYTFTLDGKQITEKDGVSVAKPYTIEKARDIFTGDSCYVISGIVQWKVESITNDTLFISDNFVDGYHYALTRAK